MQRTLDGSKKEGEWLLRGMATAPEVSGQGIGKKILYTVVKYCQQSGGTVIWCKAREGALGFYEAAGFEIIGEAFELPDIGPHRAMRLKLPRQT